jgi:glycerate kinase
MTLKILVAPSGFKESLDAAEVADCIEKGILLALPDAKIMKAPLVDGGGELSRLEHIDMRGRDRRLATVEIDAACNWQNILCGPNGVSRVYGAQKGATPEQVEKLAGALEHLAAVIARELKIEVREIPAGGASGGLGAGLHALLGARLHPRYEIITNYLEVESLLKNADIVFTAEGAIDGQTPRGKIPSEVAKRAKRYHLPVIALVGTVGENARTNLECGIDSYTSILSGSCTLAEAIKNTSEMLVDTAEQVMRTLMVGQKLQLLENQIKPSHKKLRKDGTGGKNCDDTKRQ